MMQGPIPEVVPACSVIDGSAKGHPGAIDGASHSDEDSLRRDTGDRQGVQM